MRFEKRVRNLLPRRLAAPFVAVGLILASFAPAAAETRTSAPLPTWRRLPPAPIEGRIDAGAVWTGEEVVVWGGVTHTGTVEAVDTGAAYHPDLDEWDRIADAPRRVLGGAGSAAAWTGRVAVFWAGNSPDGPARGAIYRPSRDAWTRLPHGPLGPREGYVSFWTGRELVILGGTSGDGFPNRVGAAVTPRTTSWRRLPGLEQVEGLVPAGAVWTGDVAYVGGLRYLCPELGSMCTDVERILVAYDPVADTVADVDLSDAPVTGWLRPIAWAGGELLVSVRDTSRLLLYDPSTGGWREAAAPPCVARHRQVAWIGDRFVSPCGPTGLQLYTPGTDTWLELEAGASAFNSNVGSAIAWTGDELFVWSGVARRGGGTPNRGTVIDLA